MSNLTSRWDLAEIEVSASAQAAALRVVERMTAQRNDIESQWNTAIRLAKANGASLRDIAGAAAVSPQTVANICNAVTP